MKEAVDPGEIAAVVEVEGVFQILLLERKVNIELITPTLHADEQILIADPLTAEVVEADLLTAEVVEVVAQVVAEVPVHVK